VAALELWPSRASTVLQCSGTKKEPSKRALVAIARPRTHVQEKGRAPCNSTLLSRQIQSITAAKNTAHTSRPPPTSVHQILSPSLSILSSFHLYYNTTAGILHRKPYLWSTPRRHLARPRVSFCCKKRCAVLQLEHMVIKFLIAAIAVVAIVFLAWHFGDRIADRHRLKRWERTERTKRYAKKKAKAVQEAVDVLYNEIDGKEEKPP